MITAGLDFGTTNSTIGYNDGSKSKLINLGNGKAETRTVLFEDVESKSFIVGDDGIKHLINGDEGRLLQSPKSFLNTKEEVMTILLGRPVKLTQIISIILQEFKERVESELNEDINNVLLGRPVNFHDEDKYLDRLAQDRLESAAKLAGFKNVEFQLEPLAAAKAYQSTMPEGREEKVIIADLGGGTSDFSVIHMTSKSMEILGNTGIYIGGNDFDRILSYDFFSQYLGKGSKYSSMGKLLEVPTTFFHLLSDWRRIHELGDRKIKIGFSDIFLQSLDREKMSRMDEIIKNPLLGYNYFKKVEGTKKQLSQTEFHSGKFNIFTQPFNFDITRGQFEGLVRQECEKIILVIKELLKQSEIKAEQIDKIFLTGGSSLLPIIQHEVEALLGSGKISNSERFSSVGYGLTLESYEKFK